MWIYVAGPTMPKVTGRVFKSGNSAAVRLPKEVAFAPDTELTIVRSGDVITMYPTPMSNAELVRRLEQLPRPSSTQEREPLELPDREGL